jgi:hypothetical protein
MPDKPDENMFSKTVKDAANLRKQGSPATPPAIAPVSKQNAAPLANTRTAETKALNVQISAHKFDWIKATANKNHWTNRTVVEIALDALREKLGD